MIVGVLTRFPGIFWLPWHHPHLHQEHPCPPRLQEETWRIVGVLTSFLMLDLDESFSKASLGYFYTLIPFPAQTRTSLPPKTPGGDLDDMWILEKLLDEIFSKASQRYFAYHDTIPNSTKVCIVCKVSSIVDNKSQGLSSRNKQELLCSRWRRVRTS